MLTIGRAILAAGFYRFAPERKEMVMATMRVRLAALICITGLFALVVSTASASAATCTGKPHDGTDNSGKAQIDVSCDTAISNGSFTIKTNRGVDNSIDPPRITGGSGSDSFSCNPNGSSITCNGSMIAGAAAHVRTFFGPNACGSPKFSGTLTVAFG